MAGSIEARRQFEQLIQSLKDPTLSEMDRFGIRLNALILDGAAWNDPVLEQPARALVQEFPKQPGGYFLLVSIAESADKARRIPLAEEILKMENAPEEVKTRAKAILKRTER